MLYWLYIYIYIYIYTRTLYIYICDASQVPGASGLPSSSPDSRPTVQTGAVSILVPKPQRIGSKYVRNPDKKNFHETHDFSSFPSQARARNPEGRSPLAEVVNRIAARRRPTSEYNNNEVIIGGQIGQGGFPGARLVIHSKQNDVIFKVGESDCLRNCYEIDNFHNEQRQDGDGIKSIKWSREPYSVTKPKDKLEKLHNTKPKNCAWRCASDNRPVGTLVSLPRPMPRHLFSPGLDNGYDFDDLYETACTTYLYVEKAYIIFVMIIFMLLMALIACANVLRPMSELLFLNKDDVELNFQLNSLAIDGNEVNPGLAVEYKRPSSSWESHSQPDRPSKKVGLLLQLYAYCPLYFAIIFAIMTISYIIEVLNISPAPQLLSGSSTSRSLSLSLLLCVFLIPLIFLYVITLR